MATPSLSLPSSYAIQNEEHWKELCAQAGREQDPMKLLELVQEINRLLEAKQNRLTKAPQF